MSHQKDQKQFLNQTEAAVYLGMSPKTLERWRSEKTHLTYSKIGGAVRYRKSDLDIYADSTRVRVS